MPIKRASRRTKGAKAANKSTKKSVYAKTPADVISLSNWTLQLPIGTPSKPHPPKVISASQLVKGFQNQYFMYDGSDNSVAFFAPDNGVKTPHSIHPRSELREMQPDGTTPANWDPFDSMTHTMKATLMVTDACHRLCIGQIHIGYVPPDSPPSTKPLMELYYEKAGDLTVGLNSSPTSGQTETKIGHVSVGTKFSYQISVSGGTLKVYINGTQQYSQAMPSSFKGYGQYFKAGDYNQTKSYSSSNGTRDKFYALSLSHK